MAVAIESVRGRLHDMPPLAARVLHAVLKVDFRDGRRLQDKHADRARGLFPNLRKSSGALHHVCDQRAGPECCSGNDGTECQCFEARPPPRVYGHDGSPRTDGKQGGHSQNSGPP